MFFRQFALTIASSTIISTFNSLTLSPALAAMLLKPRKKKVYEALPWPAFLLFGCWAGYTVRARASFEPGEGTALAGLARLGGPVIETLGQLLGCDRKLATLLTGHWSEGLPRCP